MIMAGRVEVDEVKAEKPGREVKLQATVSVRQPRSRYVSRGGIKLEAALAHPLVNVRNQVIIDVGASTGGFTDCLLQHGAEKVIAVDVGYGQLAWRLRNDPRVEVRERTNIRYLAPSDVHQDIDGAVIDVSFISLKLVIPPVSRLLKEKAFIIALIKPQFEVGKGQVGKGGIVRDPGLRDKVIAELRKFCLSIGWTARWQIPSPIVGAKGNQESLLYLERSAQP
jgi:23S rRNA (cytidine1920-2'-O)/16S rRNA (cytidine1409-2'-O)-methyltransferase